MTIWRKSKALRAEVRQGYCRCGPLSVQPPQPGLAVASQLAPYEARVTFDRVRSQPPAAGSLPPDWGHLAHSKKAGK